MLVACRLAGLSALEGHYAGVNARAMRADAELPQHTSASNRHAPPQISETGRGLALAVPACGSPNRASRGQPATGAKIERIAGFPINGEVFVRVQFNGPHPPHRRASGRWDRCDGAYPVGVIEARDGGATGETGC